MLNIEYLIVGQGVAGSCLALKLIREKKSFVVIDEDVNKASTVAVGAYNVVVLKRFAQIWHAEEQLKLMRTYFSEFEKLLGQKFVTEMPTYRIFKDPSEITTWQKKSVKDELNQFLDDKIIKTPVEDLDTQLGYAEVKQTGRIDLENCLKLFKKYLTENNHYLNQRFDYSELKMTDDGIVYNKGIKSKKIIFCEGFGIKNNPYFNYLPVIGVKGEVLKIKTKTIVPKAIWKAYNFLMPVDGQICYTASTYDRDDLTPVPTEKGKLEIEKHLKELYKNDYEILEHTAGIRPTVVDRRPLIGSHPEMKNVYILNGMGTRGTLLAPQMTEFLFDFIEKQIPIDNEADIRRFDKIYFSTD